MEPQAPAPSSNKKWYVIGGIVIVLILVGSYLRHGRYYGPDGMMKNNYDGSTTYSNEQGSVTVGKASMPENWPSDAPANFAGGTIQYSGTSNPQTGKAGSVVVYSAHATAQEVGDYYKKELASKGWTLNGSATTPGGYVLGAKKDTRTFGLTVVPAEGGLVSVTVGVEL